MITINGNNYYTTKEAAEKLGVQYRTLQRYVINGKIKPYKIGPKKFVFTDEVLEKYLKGE